MGLDNVLADCGGPDFLDDWTVGDQAQCGSGSISGGSVSDRHLGSLALGVARVFLAVVETLCALTLTGCMVVPQSIEDVDDDISPSPIVLPDPDSLSQPQTLPSITVAASADAFTELRGWLGEANTITVGKAMKVTRPDVTLNIPAGANVSYAFDDSAGTFQFTKPLPTVTASVLGFRVSPTLSQVVLTPDGSGVASTGLGRRGFRWLADESSGVAASESKPQVWAYSQPNCPPCIAAKKEFEEVADLPFEVVWRDDPPTWLESRPAFWWHVSGDEPSQADVNNTRQQTGWKGLKDFLGRWKNSRQPTNSMRAGRPASRPFAQPDRSSIGSRSVAIWSIDGDFTPSRSVLLSHLTNDGIHRGQHDRDMLESLTTEHCGGCTTATILVDDLCFLLTFKRRNGE
jgi:hypothetical protein